MAVVTGTVQAVHGFTSGVGPTLQSTISAVEYQTMGCFVEVTFPTGTYASADDARFDAPTAIAAARRNDKTVTLLGGCFVAAGDENGSIIGAGACTVSSAHIKAGLTQEDLSTERADGAMSAVWNRPLTFFVSFYETVEP